MPTTTTQPAITTAPDGIAEISMTHIRANLTRVIRNVRETGVDAALTDRGERRVYVVTAEWYEQARQAMAA